MVMQAIEATARVAGQQRTQSYGTERIAPVRRLGLSVAAWNGLEWYFRVFESAIGIRSSHSSQLEAWSSGGHSSSGAFHDRMPDLIDKGTVRKAAPIYRALLETPTAQVVVLSLLCGPGSPDANTETFGDIAPIAHLTDTAEAAREILALHAGESRDVALCRAFSANRERRQSEFAREFWHAAGRAVRLDDLVTKRLTAPRCQTEDGARITNEMEARRIGWWDVMAKILDAYAYDGELPARLSTLASADLEISARDAIRAKLAPFSGANKEARAAHMAARKEFISGVKTDGEQLRINAACAYKAALDRT